MKIEVNVEFKNISRKRAKIIKNTGWILWERFIKVGEEK